MMTYANNGSLCKVCGGRLPSHAQQCGRCGTATSLAKQPVLDIKIKAETLPERCEICHQTDLFDAATNSCQRCKQVIVPTTQQSTTTKAYRSINLHPDAAHYLTGSIKLFAFLLAARWLYLFLIWPGVTLSDLIITLVSSAVFMALAIKAREVVQQLKARSDEDRPG